MNVFEIFNSSVGFVPPYKKTWIICCIYSLIFEFKVCDCPVRNNRNGPTIYKRKKARYFLQFPHKKVVCKKICFRDHFFTPGRERYVNAHYFGLWTPGMPDTFNKFTSCLSLVSWFINHHIYHSTFWQFFYFFRCLKFWKT